MKARVIAFCKKETVFVIAVLIAIVSAFFVMPSMEYLGYLDYKVLALLFCLMIIVAGLKEQGTFTYLGERLAGKVKNSRQMCLLLVLLCFFSSMFITNDVALLTFVPFAIELLYLAGLEDKCIKVVVLQTIAANLGSMFTPVGNPQNLYLYGVSGMGILEFLLFMLPLTVLSLGMLLVVILMEKPKAVVTGIQEEEVVPDKKKVLIYAALFVICLLTVIRILPWQVSLAIVSVAIFIVDRKLFSKVDYCLLGTFVGFFIFVGNMQNIPAISEMLQRLLYGRELILSVLASQVISNVPAAMLLSGFTENYREILYGVNIGGLGTLIASLASVISYKLYGECKNAQRGKYMGVFTAYNLVFLAVLLVASCIS
ncbi:MAG: anion permease [Lachnospiraceae bacterium]|nr:anion permease [Lachnospiraceae bacterium]